MLFEPDSGLPMSTKQVAAARAVCYGCPVRRDCLAFALTQKEAWGVWGGFTAPERKRMLLLAQAEIMMDQVLVPTHLEQVAKAIAMYDAGDLPGKVIVR